MLATELLLVDGVVLVEDVEEVSLLAKPLVLPVADDVFEAAVELFSDALLLMFVL